MGGQEYLEDCSLEKLLSTALSEDWLGFLLQQRRWELQAPHAAGGRQGNDGRFVRAPIHVLSIVEDGEFV